MERSTGTKGRLALFGRTMSFGLALALTFPAVGQTKDAPSNGQNKPLSVQDSKSPAKPAVAGEDAASAQKLKLGPLDPSTPPPNLPTNRPVIGVALGGGAALAMTEIGTLQWFEDHHIPVDVIAGTSMGSILAALYSTGHTPDEMKHILTNDSIDRVFSLHSDYASLNYRRREDEREIPAGLGVGLKHGVGFRNSLFTDTGLNEVLDREFLRYNDQTDFNNLPIPFRCQATDLNDAKTVTFSRGSLQDAVRASASIPGVFRPFAMNGHEYVDGAILENLPTEDVKAMGANVILAISLPLQPVGKGDLDSILGVLSRAFAVGIESNEERARKLANVVIVPDVKGFGSSDYVKSDELAKRGYEAAEAHKAELLPYALNDADWQAYLARKKSKERPPAGKVLQVKVKAPNAEVASVVQTKFAPLVGQPVDPDKIEKLLGDLRADGRYDADYTVGYDQRSDTQPIILVSLDDKKTGPPFLDVGVDVQAPTGSVPRTTLATITQWQDLGGYGSSARFEADGGFITKFSGEYYWKPYPLGSFFLAPRSGITREPYYIYEAGTLGEAAPLPDYRLSERQSQITEVGGDAGFTDGRFQELRFGWAFKNVQWTQTTGNDSLPNLSGNAQTARIRYVFDNQDRALVPRFGFRIETTAGYLYNAVSSPNTPEFTGQIAWAETLSTHNTFLINAEGGTFFHRDVAQPFRFTLGGPLRLGASAIEEYRGTDYFLFTPGYLREIAHLPRPLGNNIYVGGTYEVGRMFAPEYGSVLRQDVYFGLVAETPLGVITIAPAIGTNGERKFVFTIGKFF